MSFFAQHGLPLLFAAVAIESFGIPVPGETALVAFGVLASQGHYSIAIVIALAAAGAIVGDNLGFWLIGRRERRALRTASRPQAARPRRRRSGISNVWLRDFKRAPSIVRQA